VSKIVKYANQTGKTQIEIQLLKRIRELEHLRDGLISKIERLQGERDEFAVDVLKLQAQLTTATEDFNITWEALMKLEGKFALVDGVLREVKFLVRTHVGQGEILDTIDEALAELDK